MPTDISPYDDRKRVSYMMTSTVCLPGVVLMMLPSMAAPSSVIWLMPLSLPLGFFTVMSNSASRRTRFTLYSFSVLGIQGSISIPS